VEKGDSEQSEVGFVIDGFNYAFGVIFGFKFWDWCWTCVFLCYWIDYLVRFWSFGFISSSLYYEFPEEVWSLSCFYWMLGEALKCEIQRQNPQIW